MLDRAGVNLGASQRVGVDQIEQSADLVKAEAKPSALADKHQPFQLACIVVPLAAGAARRLRHDADALVIADRLDIDAASA